MALELERETEYLPPNKRQAVSQEDSNPFSEFVYDEPTNSIGNSFFTFGIHPRNSYEVHTTVHTTVHSHTHTPTPYSLPKSVPPLPTPSCVPVETPPSPSVSPVSKSVHVPVPVSVPVATQSVPMAFASVPMFMTNNTTTTVSKKAKQTIPKHIRNLVWNYYIGDNIIQHRCLCCKKTVISNTQFEVGHVLSERDGGTLELSNLRPICGPCNRSMGTMHMVEYVKKYGLFIG